MLSLQVALLALGWELYLFLVGWYWAGRLGWSSLERLATAFALGLFGVFLEGFGIYALQPPALVTLLVVVAAALPGLVALWREGLDGAARLALLGHQVLLWVLLLGQSVLINFGGGFWYGDWYEHYERTLWFLHAIPQGPLLGGYAITARPPLCNLAMTLPLGFLGVEFWRYQVVIVVLSSLVFFPLACWAARPRQQAWLLLLLVTNLYLFRNASYTWTKLPSALFVLLGGVLYLKALADREGGSRLPASAAALTAGVLAHYMAAPYLLVVASHAVLTSFWRPAWRRWVVLAALTVVLVVAPWLTYSALHFGWQQTFMSNTTAGSFANQSLAQSLHMVSSNLVNTLIPAQLRGGHPPNLQPQLLFEPFWSRLRDEIYLLCLNNVLLALGCASWVCLALRRPEPSRLFWQLAVPLFVLSVAVVPGIDPYGEAHIGLSPLILAALAGIACLAAAAPARQQLAVAAAAGLDGAAVLLHAILEAFPPVEAGRIVIGGAAPQNWDLKVNQLHLAFLADLLGSSVWTRGPLIAFLAICQGAWWQEIRASSRETAN